MSDEEYFVDVFAGWGGVSRWLQSRGIAIRKWELKDGPTGDICHPATLGQLLADIRQGKVIGVMMAPHCTSFPVLETVLG